MYLLDTNMLIYVFKNEGKVSQRLLQQSRFDIAIPFWWYMSWRSEY